MDYLTSNEIKNREFEQMCTFADVLAECRRDLLRGFWDDVPQRELRQTLNSLGKHGPEHFKLRCRLYFLKWERQCSAPRIPDKAVCGFLPFVFGKR